MGCGSRRHGGAAGWFKIHIALTGQSDNFCLTTNFRFDWGAFLSKCCSNSREAFCFGLY
jgi:hypothetical protein